MNRARNELDRLSAQAWRELGDDVTRSVRRLGQVGVAGAKKHPILVLAAGGLLVALAVSRFRRPAPAVVDRPRSGLKFGGLARRLIRAGRLWLIQWLSSVAAPAAKGETESQVESLPANGRTHG
jgi:hypothetical protein